MSEQPSASSLFEAFVHPKHTAASVAEMPYDILLRMVKHRRKKDVGPLMRDLPLSDEQIAQIILGYAQDALLASTGAGTQEALWRGLALNVISIQQEQTKQTEYLKQINRVIQLFGLLLVLAIVSWCLLTIFGTPRVF